MSLTRRDLLTSAALLLASPRGAFAANEARPGGASAAPTADHPYLLHWNENPYGPPPAAREAIAGTIQQTCRYLTPNDEDALIALLAGREGVAPQQIVTGTGSGELLRALGLMVGREGGEIVTADPTYDELVEYGRQTGGTIVTVPLDKNLRQDLDAMQKVVTEKTRLVYLCNPHNPSGTGLNAGRIASFIEAMPPQVIVVVDEAYIEFANGPGVRSLAPLLRTGANIVVLRTFSKLYGMAGLRFGYAIAPKALAEAFGPLRMTWANVFAAPAVRAALGDIDFAANTRRRIQASRLAITGELANLGLRYAEPQGNFVFFDTGMPHARFATQMKAEHVIVGRKFAPYDNWCRITVGTEPEVDWFLKSLRKVTAKGL